MVLQFIVIKQLMQNYIHHQFIISTVVLVEALAHRVLLILNIISSSLVLVDALAHRVLFTTLYYLN